MSVKQEARLFPSSTVSWLVEDLLNSPLWRFETTMERFLVTGGVRRGLKEIQAADVLVVPKWSTAEPGEINLFGEAEEKPRPRNLFAAELLRLTLQGDARWLMLAGHKPMNEEHRGGIVLYEGLPVRFHYCTPSTWGAMMVLKTGNADFVQYICDKIQLRRKVRMSGRALRPYFAGKRTDKEIQAMEIVPAPTEQEVFDAAGLEWVPPNKRYDGGVIIPDKRRRSW